MHYLRLIVGLIRVNRQQIEIGGQDLLRRLPVCAQDFLQFVFRLFIGRAYILRHLQRYGDLFVVRQVFAHVGEGEKCRVFQQEAGKYQRRYAGQLL